MSSLCKLRVNTGKLPVRGGKKPQSSYHHQIQLIIYSKEETDEKSRKWVAQPNKHVERRAPRRNHTAVRTGSYSSHGRHPHSRTGIEESLPPKARHAPSATGARHRVRAFVVVVINLFTLILSERASLSDTRDVLQLSWLGAALK